jgi:hypothetical protein
MTNKEKLLKEIATASQHIDMAGCRSSRRDVAPWQEDPRPVTPAPIVTGFGT